MLWRRTKSELKDFEIGLDQWRLVIDKLHDAGIRIVEIFGGNVFLRKNLLISVLNYLKEKNFIIHLPTNQIGLDDDIAEAIVKNVDRLYLSTDGVGDFQDQIRGQKGAFHRSEDSIAKLRRFRSDKSTPRLICNTTVSKYNVDILEDIIKYALEKKYDEIHFEYVGEFTKKDIDNSDIDGLKPYPYYLKQDESVLLDKKGAMRLKDTLSLIKNKYRNNGIGIVSINIDALSTKDLYQGNIPHKKCYAERTEVTVDPGGNLIPCPFISNYNYGSLLDSAFDNVWNNDKHKKFRKFQNRGKLQMCDHCILGVQRNPTFFTSLKRMYLFRIQPLLSEQVKISNSSR